LSVGLKNKERVTLAEDEVSRIVGSKEHEIAGRKKKITHQRAS
jgi:hypothetical protein